MPSGSPLPCASSSWDSSSSLSQPVEETNQEIETLAIFVHGAGAAFNGLGVIYNVRRRQWFDTAMNLAGCLYHAVAAWKHAKDK